MVDDLTSIVAVEIVASWTSITRPLPSVEFGQQRFREQLLQPALFGATATFRRSRGVEEREEADAADFEQSDPERTDVLASLEMHADGALVYGLAPSQDQSPGHSMIRMFVVDEDEVEHVLGAFVGFTNVFFGRLEQSPLIAKAFLATSVSGIDGKAFGHCPSVDPSQMTLLDHRLDDPLHDPRPPLRVARAALAGPSGRARRVTNHIARACRVAGAYDSPPRP
jgi:hypothetical protein